MEEEPLAGGVANAGAVTRRGDHVLRPSNPSTGPIHDLLRHLRAEGFEGAPLPIGIEPDGRERLEYVPGDVPLAPYPAWARRDEALASLAALQRSFHEASATFDGARRRWCDELADPRGGPVLCHNDLCLENVVFRSGEAVALLDFDFAAPGRAVHDLAQTVRMCVPVDDPRSARRLGWEDDDLPARLRLAVDAYGLDRDGRQELLSCLDDTMARGGQFLRRRVARGDPNFAALWEEVGGQERFDRRRRWWEAERPVFERAMG